MIELTGKISENLNNERLDKSVSVIFPEYSRTALTRAIIAGHCLVDNQICIKPKTKCSNGAKISLKLDTQNIYTYNPEQADVAQKLNLDFEVIYQDKNLIVINKPPGLVVHPAAGNPDQTLVNGLLYKFPELAKLPRAGIIHRLDKNTSGLLIVARNTESYFELIKLMQSRKIKREYIALVHGQILTPKIINAPIGRHIINRQKMSVIKTGREAISYFRPLEIDTSRKFTLLQVQLETGRTHQIRVHAQHNNTPIVGDPLYGGSRCWKGEFNRQALHAWRLRFMGLDLKAELPEDYKNLLISLEFQEKISTL